MSVDITNKVQSITTKLSVNDIECSGTVVLAGTDLIEDGTVALDKQFFVSLGFSPTPPILNLRGVVAGIRKADTADGDKETIITLMSPFKNYRKQRIYTVYFPNDTPITTPMGMIAENYMGLAPDEYNFSSMAGTLQKFRINRLNIPEALRLFAAIENEELCWIKGVLKTKGLGPSIDYDKSRCSVVDVEDEKDIQIINTLNVYGAEMTPDLAPEPEEIGSLIIADGELNEGVDRWYFYAELTKVPAIDITVDADITSKFDFSYEGMKGNFAIILATRHTAGAQGETTITVEGRPFKPGQIYRKVVRTVPVPGYNDIDTEADYYNPFIQSWVNAGTVGQYQLVFNKYSMKQMKVIAPHNPDLELNSLLSIKEGEDTLYTLIVREIETKWLASNGLLEDEITGWVF